MTNNQELIDWLRKTADANELHSESIMLHRAASALVRARDDLVDEIRKGDELLVRVQEAYARAYEQGRAEGRAEILATMEPI